MSRASHPPVDGHNYPVPAMLAPPSHPGVEPHSYPPPYEASAPVEATSVPSLPSLAAHNLNMAHAQAYDDSPNEPRKGRRKIDIAFIEDKSRRHITFSKRKAGIIKKAYELATLTGTQVLLLVASETGHVYTFATPKLQPLITNPEGKNLIQACLNAPDAPAQQAEQAAPHGDYGIPYRGHDEHEKAYYQPAEYYDDGKSPPSSTAIPNGAPTRPVPTNVRDYAQYVPYPGANFSAGLPYPYSRLPPPQGAYPPTQYPPRDAHYDDSEHGPSG